METDEVVIDWTVTEDNGSPITEYKVLIQKSDNNFAQEMSNCNGSSIAVMRKTQCTIPVARLRANPFRLAWGSEIIVKLIATNVYGDSSISLEGRGAIIITKPDAPLSLAEVFD